MRGTKAMTREVMTGTALHRFAARIRAALLLERLAEIRRLATIRHARRPQC